MAYVQFYDGLPFGCRLADLFASPASGISLTATITPNLASFEVASSRGRVPVTYYGPSLSMNQGSVAAMTFGFDSNPWIVYGSASSPLAQFSYSGGLAAFHAGGAAAAALVMAGADHLQGSSNGDFLEGYGGDDTLSGGRGADTMAGGIGNDLYFVSDSNDRIFEAFDGGTDTVVTRIGYTLSKSSHIEVLQAASGRTALTLTGNAYANHIIGNSGKNLIDGAGGADTLAGGAGNDTYRVGSTSAVVLEGAGEGADTILARSNFTLSGGSAVEKLVAEGKRGLRLAGNELNNTVVGNNAGNVIDGMGGRDTVYGGTGRDVIRGGEGGDALYGGDGADRLYGENGDDILYGGPSNGILWGGAGNDRIYGSWNNDSLRGEAGSDRLFGDTGNDVLSGGEGRDRISSGEGYDRFVFDTPLDSRTNVDTLVDLNPWADQIRLKLSVFSEIGRTGKLSASRFWIGDEAHTKSHRIIYDKDSGSLYYDPDGTGSASQIKFASVGKLELSASAFVVF